MPKYIDADAFLLQYSILTSRPEFMPFSAEMSTWKLWKQEFDRSVQLLVSRMITEQESDEQKVVAMIKEIPVAQIPIVCCKDCKYRHTYKCPIGLWVEDNWFCYRGETE